jgi:energy-coupling factor transport system permease protein
MEHRMRLEIYVPRASPVHALHPATKLALFIVALAAPFLTNDPFARAIGLVAALAVAAAGGVLREVLAPWKLLAFIFVMTAVLWGFLGDAPTPRARWIASLAYALHVTAMFIYGLVFLATTRTEETIHALGSFRVPYRLAFALGLAFRLVPLSLTSAASILDAQRARGLDLATGSALERLRKYVPVLVPIFMTSLRSADQMAMALDARGFAHGGTRTRWKTYEVGVRDAVALLLGAAYAAVFWLMRAGTLSSVPGG